jgi:hypothetical protein
LRKLTKGRIKSGQRRLNILSLVFSIHCPENPLKFQLQGVFALWGSESNVVIISLFFHLLRSAVKTP